MLKSIEIEPSAALSQDAIEEELKCPNDWSSTAQMLDVEKK